MLKRLTCGLLAAVLLLGLAGCGETEPKEELRQEGLWYEATGISPDAAIFTMDGREVKAERLFYWLAYTCDYINSYYTSSGVDVDWNETAGGVSLQAYALQNAMDNTILYETIEAMAEEYGCAITESDLGAISMEWDAMVAEFGGEEAYLEGLATMGLDKAGAERMAQDQFLYSHLYDLYCEEGSALCPTQADLDAFEEEQGYLTVDHMLLYAESSSEEDMERCRTRAAEAMAQLTASGDPAAAFAEVAATYSDEDRTEYPEGYTYAAADGSMPEAFTEAARQLEENQVSQVIDLNGGCCIILRKPLNQDTLRMDYFDHLVQSRAKAAEIGYSEELQALTVPEFYANVTAAREAMRKAETTTEE